MNELMRVLLFLPPQGSSFAKGIDELHYFVITVTMLMSCYVGFAAVWFSIRYRMNKHDQLTPHIEASLRAEWAIIVALLSLFLLWWVIGYRQIGKMFDPPRDSLVTYVTAKQWMWKFAYTDGHSANDVLTVPVGRPVKLVMTSRDVLHSFFVPGFRIKQDVIPGRYVTVWFEATKTGVYPIYCAEYCGVSHSRMLGSVVVLSAEDYGAWLHDQGRDRSDVQSELASRGAQIAEKRACLACHTLNGQPHVGPTWSRLYGSTRVLQDGRQVIADDAYLTKSMMEPNADIVIGFKPVMPTYEGVLTAPDTAALVEFIRALRDGPISAGVSLPSLSVTPAPTSPTSEADAGSMSPRQVTP